jgi:transposase
MNIQRPTRCSNRTRGGKGERHPDPEDPPRRRANKRRGHGSYDNDRPPIVGSVGRHTGEVREVREVRLRVVEHTDQKTLVAHVHSWLAAPEGNDIHGTDEWRAYKRVDRKRIERSSMVSRSGRATMTEMGSGRFSREHHRRIMDNGAQLPEDVPWGSQEVLGWLCVDVRIRHQPQARHPRLHLFTCCSALCMNMSQPPGIRPGPWSCVPSGSSPSRRGEIGWRSRRTRRIFSLHT